MEVRCGGRLWRIAEYDREEFIRERWSYHAGEHVTFLRPTQGGKTTLAYQLIEASASPKVPALSLIMKPRDKVPAEWLRKLSHQRLDTYPPALWHRGRPGYFLWPRRSKGPGAIRRDNARMAGLFGNALDEVYSRGQSVIVFADEAVGLSKILKLDTELIAIWTQGTGMGVGLWAASQKPSHMPTFAYNQAEHIFLGNDPDKRNRDRFAEIGGVDPELIKAVVQQLGPYEWLYIRRTGSVMCVVRA